MALLKRENKEKGQNLSLFVPNREDFKTLRSRHNSYIRDASLSKNMSDASSYFYGYTSHKEEDGITNILSVHVNMEGIEGDLKIGENTNIELRITNIFSKISISNGILKTMNLNIDEIGFAILQSFKLRIFNPSKEGNTKCLEIAYTQTDNEDHHISEIKAEIEIETVQCEISTMKIKDLLTDFNNFKEILVDKKVIKEEKKENIVENLQQKNINKKFVELSLNYQMVDLILKEEEESIEVGVKLSSGRISQNSSKKINLGFKNEIFTVYLKVTKVENFKKISTNQEFPIIIVKNISLNNSSQQLNKENKGLFSKTDFKIEETSIVLCEEYITHLHCFIEDKLTKAKIIIEFLEIMKNTISLQKNEEIKENLDKISMNKEEDVKREENKEEEKSHLNVIKTQFTKFNLKTKNSFSMKAAVEKQRELIKTHAFIDSKFKQNIVDKRCEALLDYNLSSSTSVEISHIKFVWIYKFSMNSTTF